MAKKHVDLTVLQFALESLSQTIADNFARKNVTVTSLEIVKGVPSNKTDSTEQEQCIKVIYADNTTSKSHYVLLGLKDLLGGNDLSSYYTKTETDTLLTNKVDQTTIDGLISRIGVLEGNTVDTTTIDAIIVDLRKDLDKKLTSADLTDILTDIDNLKTGKLNVNALPTNVSAFVNDANYATKDDIKTETGKTLTSAKSYTDTEIAKVNAINPDDYYKKTEIDTKLSKKASTDLASSTSNGLLSSDLYNIISEIDPANLGKNGENGKDGKDGETPTVLIENVSATSTATAGQKVTISTSKQSKSFTVYNGVGIKSGEINKDNHLVLVTNTGLTLDCGNINSEALDLKTLAINTSGHLIATLTDNSTKDLGQVKGDRGVSVTSIAVDTNKHMIITYSEGDPQDIGIIEGIKGKDGKGISSCTIGSNNKLTITYTDGTTYTSGNLKGATGRGISSIEVNDAMEIVAKYDDNTTETIGSITSPFVVGANINDEGELIFTYNNGDTSNQGKINGVEGASIREYTNLTLNQLIKGGCYLIYNNQLYRVDSDFNCTQNFWIDSDLHMTKLSTDTQLHDLYNDYVETTTDSPKLSFEEWFQKWLVTTTDDPIVAEAKIVVPSTLAGSFKVLSFTESTNTDIFVDNGTIKLPYNGSFILTADVGKINASHDNRKYIGIFNKTKNKMVAYKTTYPNGLSNYIMDTSFTQIISGVQGEEFQVKYASGTSISNVISSELPRIALYRMTYTQPVITMEEMYNEYKNQEDDPSDYDDWVKSIFQRDQCRMVGRLEETLEDTYKSKLLTGFEYSSGSRDLIPENGIFTAPYSGLYYMRLQVRFGTPKNFPSRLYLVKNFVFGETGYSARIIAQATDGYTSNSDYVESLDSIFWMNQGDFFTIGFECTAAINNTIYTMADGFEYGLLSSGIGGGSAGSGSSGAGVTSYSTIGYGTLVRKDELILHNNRIYVANENFSVTQSFNTDHTYLTQIYGSGNGINDYALLSLGEEFRIGEFILHREYVTSVDEDGNDYTKTVDILYEVTTDFSVSGIWDTDKTNLKRTLGEFEDYQAIIDALKLEIKELQTENTKLQTTIDDLGLILDDINRKVV